MTSPIAEIVQDENEGSRFVVLFCQISRFRFSTRLITHAHARRRAPAHPERRASWCPSAAKPINLLRLAPFRGGANPTPFQSRSLIQSYHRAQTHPESRRHPPRHARAVVSLARCPAPIPWRLRRGCRVPGSMRVPKIVVAQMHAVFRRDDSLVVVEGHRTQGPADIVRAARRTGEVCTMTQSASRLL